MATKKKPWRTVIVGGDTGRFTWEQIDAAITKAIARREAREARAAKRAAAAKPSDAAAPARNAKTVLAANRPSGERKKEGKMPNQKKPWPTIIVGGGSGRFTPEQIRAAVRAVKEKNERREARRARKLDADRKASLLSGGMEPDARRGTSAAA